MTPEEMINSDDIETAELGINILYQQGMNIVNIEELLKNTLYVVKKFDRVYISLEIDFYKVQIKEMRKLSLEIERELMYGKYKNEYRRTFKIRR